MCSSQLSQTNHAQQRNKNLDFDQEILVTVEATRTKLVLKSTGKYEKNHQTHILMMHSRCSLFIQLREDMKEKQNQQTQTFTLGKHRVSYITCLLPLWYHVAETPQQCFEHVRKLANLSSFSQNFG